MKVSIRVCMPAVCLLVTMTISLGPAVRHSAAQTNKQKHHHYRVIDLGTLGGASSGLVGAPSRVLTNGGTIIGVSDTTTPDPFTRNCFNDSCTVLKSFVWQNERLTELPSLASRASNVAYEENDRRWEVGFSETGSVDPMLGTPQI